jgi:RNA polymerase sigma-70 factor (ECF subfamily)
MQELFIRMSRSKSFTRAEDSTAYVIRAAVNLAFEWRRKEKRTIQSVGFDAMLTSRDTSPADALEVKEQAAQVMDALDQISDLGREVIVLHRLQGQSYESIAAQMNKTPHQVRAICSKAIGQIRERLSAPLSTKEESK